MTVFTPTSHQYANIRRERAITEAEVSECKSCPWYLAQGHLGSPIGPLSNFFEPQLGLIFFYNVDEDVDSVPEDDEDKSNGGRMTKIVTTVKMTLVLMRLAMMMLLLLAAPQEANSMFFSSVR